MKSDDNNRILKKDIVWLYRAIDKYGTRQIINISNNAAIATDGFRLHAINPEGLPDAIRDEIINNTIGLQNIQAEFLINPEYLIKALKGFSSYQIKITIKSDDNRNFWGIEISDSDSDKVAFIACMKEAGSKWG